MTYAYAGLCADASPHSSGGIDPAILISVVALLVSIALPLYLDRRQAPQVSVKISFLAHLDQQSDVAYYYVASAINHGRSEVQINQINMSYIKSGSSGEEVFLLSHFRQGPNFEQGLGLSYSLKPYSNTYFGVPVAEVHDAITRDLDKCTLYGSLNLSNGYRVVSRRGLKLANLVPPKKRYPRMRHIKLLIFAKEKIDM